MFPHAGNVPLQKYYRMKIRIALALSLFSFYGAIAQDLRTISNPEVIQGVLIKITPPLSSFSPDPAWTDDIVRDENGVLRVNKDNVEHRLGGHPVVDPSALPAGKDPVWQQFLPAKKRLNTVGQNYDGMGYTNVNPADPSLCVGPNHVIQMINGSSGARFVIYNKAGGTVQAAQYMDAITGIGGLGDPVAIYDQFANRFVMTEFAATGNVLIMMVSQTANPTGSWYVYQFTTPEFPDYPKWGTWPNAYICTSNESSNKVYAFNRSTMLAGGVSPTMLSFSIAASPTIGFQAAAPVNISGTNLPPVGTSPMILRMVDDAWTAAADVDRLELWYLNADFITPANSTLVQQPNINTAAFDSDLCGYVTLNCIRQPGTNTRLDPIREIIMNRVYYRNFNTHQSLVAVHAVDPGVFDQAGCRWYEMRRTGLGAWSMYQQGTFAPDTNSRWMPTIAINSEGTIAMGYNVSSKLVYPSYRVTGRTVNGTLGQMTEPEISLIAGTASNGSNRWGDYNDMQVDPSDDVTFWTTAMYKPSTTGWNTRISSFSIFNNVLPLSLLAFEGKKMADHSILLEWDVENEQQVERYDMERKEEGGEFVVIGSVPFQTNGKSLNKYSYTDRTCHRLSENNYRLKMIDHDGKYRYSHTVTLPGDANSQAEIYPNPLQEDVLYIRLPEEMTSRSLNFTIFNTAAVPVQKITKSAEDKQAIRSVNLKELPAGVYILQISDAAGQVLAKERILRK